VVQCYAIYTEHILSSVQRHSYAHSVQLPLSVLFLPYYTFNTLHFILRGSFFIIFVLTSNVTLPLETSYELRVDDYIRTPDPCVAPHKRSCILICSLIFRCSATCTNDYHNTARTREQNRQARVIQTVQFILPNITT